MAADEQIRNHPVADFPLPVDQKRGPSHAKTERTIHAVCSDDRFLLIGKERKRQLVGVRKAAVAGLALRADADDLNCGETAVRPAAMTA